MPDTHTGVCAHPLVQSQSPGGKCLICGRVKRGGALRKKTLLTAFAIGVDQGGGLPQPTQHVPRLNVSNRPRMWKVPKDEPTGDEQITLDAEGVESLLRRCSAELMRRSFAEFVRGAWDVVNPGAPLVWGMHLDAICSHLQRSWEDLARVRTARAEGGLALLHTEPQLWQNLLINVPPRSAKTLLVAVFFPVWVWLHDPTVTIRCTSGNLRVSDQSSDQSRDLLESDWLRDTFELTWTLRGDRKAKRKFYNSRGGFRISMPMGAKVTGEGTDIIVVDDPHDAKDVYSERMRESVLNKWHTLRNRVSDQRCCLRIAIMQRLHEADFSQYWLDRAKVAHLCIPMEFEKDRTSTTPLGWCDPRTVPGELMLPEYFGPEFIAQEKVELGSYGYAGQMQQRPAPEDGGLFKKSWFKPYELVWLPSGKPDWSALPKIDQLYVTIDAAFKETDTSDFVSIQVIGQQGRMRYVLDNITRRMDFVKTLAALREVMEKWDSATKRVAGILIEDKANGSAAVTMLQTAGVAGVIEIQPEGGKMSRANAIAPACEAGDVMIPRVAPWRDAWLHELAVFPNGAHDDQVDAFTQAMNYLRGSVDVARLLASCKW